MSTEDPVGRVRVRRWWQDWRVIAGVAVAAVVAVVAVVVLRMMSPSLVTADRVDALLLDVGQINTVMGASGMQVVERESAPRAARTALSKRECLGAIAAAQGASYVGSGYTALHWTGAKEVNQPIEHYVAQAVAVFPDTDKAGAFVAASASQWSGCAGQTVAVLGANKSVVVWTLNAMVGQHPQIAISETRKDTAWSCQRALRAVSNAVIDTTACAAAITDEATVIADKIAANIT